MKTHRVDWPPRSALDERLHYDLHKTVTRRSRRMLPWHRTSFSNSTVVTTTMHPPLDIKVRHLMIMCVCVLSNECVQSRKKKTYLSAHRTHWQHPLRFPLSRNHVSLDHFWNLFVQQWRTCICVHYTWASYLDWDLHPQSHHNESKERAFQLVNLRWR